MVEQFNHALVYVQIILALFFIVVFCTIKGNKKANRFIAIFLLLFIVFALYDLNAVLQPEKPLYFVYLLSSMALLLAFPVFYFYVLSLYDIEPKKIAYHFILPLAGFLILFPGMFADWPTPVYYNNFMILEEGRQELTRWNYFVVNDLFFTVQVVIYSGLILKVIKTIRPQLEENYSNLEGKKLKWVVYLFIALALMYVFYFVTELFTDFSFAQYDLIYYCFSLLFLMSVIYGAFRQNEHFYLILINQHQEDKLPSEANTSIKLTEEEVGIIHEKLNELVSTEKFYTQRDLTLPQLAKMLDTNKNVMSQFLNQNLHQNFYKYINSLRVEEAKKLLVENVDGRYSMEGIGYLAGFNSKTTFNTVFKAQTGMSPSVFRSQING